MYQCGLYSHRRRDGSEAGKRVIVLVQYHERHDRRASTVLVQRLQQSTLLRACRDQGTRGYAKLAMLIAGTDRCNVSHGGRVPEEAGASDDNIVST